MLARTNRKLRIEVDQRLAEYMRMSWCDNDAPDYVNPCSQIAYYIVGRDEESNFQISALSVGVQCCKFAIGSSIVVGNRNDYRDNLYVVCKSCCEILDDPAKLSGDGVPDCASSVRIE